MKRKGTVLGLLLMGVAVVTYIFISKTTKSDVSDELDEVSHYEPVVTSDFIFVHLK